MSVNVHLRPSKPIEPLTILSWVLRVCSPRKVIKEGLVLFLVLRMRMRLQRGLLDWDRAETQLRPIFMETDDPLLVSTCWLECTLVEATVLTVGLLVLCVLRIRPDFDCFSDIIKVPIDHPVRNLRHHVIVSGCVRVLQMLHLYVMPFIHNQLLSVRCRCGVLKVCRLGCTLHRQPIDWKGGRVAHCYVRLGSLQLLVRDLVVQQAYVWRCLMVSSWVKRGGEVGLTLVALKFYCWVDSRTFFLSC